jgi:hypothetical protein
MPLLPLRAEGGEQGAVGRGPKVVEEVEQRVEGTGGIVKKEVGKLRSWEAGRPGGREAGRPGGQEVLKVRR